jgi:hypothetical protein
VTSSPVFLSLAALLQTSNQASQVTSCLTVLTEETRGHAVTLLSSISAASSLASITWDARLLASNQVSPAGDIQSDLRHFGHKVVDLPSSVSGDPESGNRDHEIEGDGLIISLSRLTVAWPR